MNTNEKSKYCQIYRIYLVSGDYVDYREPYEADENLFDKYLDPSEKHLIIKSSLFGTTLINKKAITRISENGVEKIS